MDLKQLTDNQLHERTIATAAEERAITLKNLKQLIEIERRHLFSKFNSATLHGYCVKYLKMSDPQAGRRVGAAKLLRDVPSIEEKIKSGSMTMTALSQISVFLKQEAKARNVYDHVMKTALLCELDNKSTREIEMILASRSTKPQSRLRDSLKCKAGGISELKVHLDHEAVEKLEHLKAIWSNSMPNANYSEIVERMIEKSIERFDPVKKAERGVKRAARKAEKTKTPAPESRSIDAQESEFNIESDMAHTAPMSPFEIESTISTAAWASQAAPTTRTPAPELSSKNVLEPDLNVESDLALASPESAKNAGGVMRLIEFDLARKTDSPAFVRNSVWFRDGGRCTFVDPVSGAQCGSLHFLEEDHIIPKAMGGEYSIENIRLRCRAHNQRHAINSYGLTKMRAYFMKSRPH